MHRRPLLELLDDYLARHPEDRVRVDHVQHFVASHEDCFERTCRPGHITASAWIVSPDHSRYLMTHHRKLDRWLQLGGHADGDAETAQVALREAQEESGMQRFRFVGPGGRPLPLDVDVHLIPANAKDPAHLHHDIRYLLVAEAGQELVMSDESNDLRWFDAATAVRDVDEESLRRMAARAPALLAEFDR